MVLKVKLMCIILVEMVRNYSFTLLKEYIRFERALGEFSIPRIAMTSIF